MSTVSAYATVVRERRALLAGPNSPTSNYSGGKSPVWKDEREVQQGKSSGIR